MHANQTPLLARACKWLPTLMQRDFEKKANPNDKQQAALLEEMRSHIKKVRQHVEQHCVQFTPLICPVC